MPRARLPEHRATNMRPFGALGKRARLRLEHLEDRTTPAGEITGTRTIITPFTPRFSANDTGDITIVGNTLETASTVGNPGRTQQDVVNAQNGAGANVNNNNWNMAFVDVDNNAATFNSSQSTLSLPAGATILFAGLYWGSVTTTPTQATARTTIQFSTPASGGYLSLTGVLTGSADFTGTPPGNLYQGFADVTALVRAAGNGTYGAANVQATLETGSYAGWSLVVAYRAPGAPARNLTVFDGFVLQAATDSALNIPISGFTAPPAGPVNASVGIVTYEGDLGTVGDSMALNGTKLSDATHPVNNFFNSTISNQGALITAKNPNFPNQLGFDVANVKVPAGVITNGATGATITLTTSGDGYFPGVVTTAIDLFSPEIEPVKTYTDLNGGLTRPGDVIEYTVTLPHTGQDAATNLFFRDPIPTNTTYLPGSLQVTAGANLGAKTDAPGDDQAEFDVVGNQVVFRLGTGANAASGGSLAIGGTTTLRFRVIVNPDTADRTVITNQGNARFNGQTTGFALSADSNRVAFTVAAQADLQLLKQVSKANPNVGDTISYTLTLSNLGPNTATGVFVQDQLPPGVAYVSSNPSQGVFNNATSFWDVGTLGSGATATLVINATVVSPNPAVNVATATSDVQDPNPNNNTSSATLVPLQADLALTKTVSDPAPNVGALVTFTLNLTNNGPNAATNVKVSDPLPPGLTIQSAVPGQGSYDPVSGIWSVGTLAGGASTTLVVVARVDDAAVKLNAAVASADQFDPNPTNNSDTATVTPQQADLAISKSASLSLAAPLTTGTPVIFAIRLANLGPNTATNVTVQDLLTAAFAFTGAIPSQGTYDPATGVWTVGTLASGATATLIITVTVTGGTPVENVATVSGADQFDPNLDNNTASATLTPPRADLALIKTVSNATPNVGDEITFTLTVTNIGPDAATNAAVNDALPAELIFVSATPGQGTYDPGAGAWAVGSLASGGSATLTIVARVGGPTAATNVATAGADQFDPDPSNNTDTATVTPQQADLAITKVVSDARPNVGDVVTYTIRVVNNGPNDATGVTVADLLPPGQAVLSQTVGRGTYDPGTGVWVIGDLAAGAAVTLTIQSVVFDVTPATNFATVGADQFDPALDNNRANATVTPRSADLALTKTISNPAPVLGETVTYTVTVTNNGPDAATGVTVTDPLPAGLSFVSAAPGQGSFDPATGTWTIGTMASGATLKLFVRATFINTDPQTNTATAVAAQFDPDLSNNTARATGTASTSVVVVPPVAPPLTAEEINKGMFLTSTPGGAGAFMPTSPQFVNSAARLGVTTRRSIGLAVGTDAGTVGVARLFDFATATERVAVVPFGGFTGGVRVAAGDVNGDGIDDLITTMGPGGLPVVFVYDGATGGLLSAFWALPPGFTGGLNVAAGDVNGDGRADVVLGLAAGGPPAVLVYDGQTGGLISAVMAFPAALSGGVSVAVGDVNGDGFADLVAGLASDAPAVAVYDGRTSALVSAFWAFAPALTGGVRVAVEHVGPGSAQVVAALSSEPVPLVETYGLSGALTAALVPPGVAGGGPRVATADVNGDGVSDFVLGSGPGGTRVVVLSGRDFAVLDDFYAFSPYGTTGVFVG